MEKRGFKRIAVTMALIGALFMFATGDKKAEAAYIDDAALQAIFSGYYQGYGEYYAALAFYYDDYTYYYDQYIYLDYARTAAYYAFLYASYSSAYYAYDAYLAALDAYYYLDAAAYYAYDVYIYGTWGSGDLSVYYGGLAAQSLALAQYYAAYLY